jgi:hypothetical protein
MDRTSEVQIWFFQLPEDGRRKVADAIARMMDVDSSGGVLVDVITSALKIGEKLASAMPNRNEQAGNKAAPGSKRVRAEEITNGSETSATRSSSDESEEAAAKAGAAAAAAESEAAAKAGAAAAKAGAAAAAAESEAAAKAGASAAAGAAESEAAAAAATAPDRRVSRRGAATASLEPAKTDDLFDFGDFNWDQSPEAEATCIKTFLLDDSNKSDKAKSTLDLSLPDVVMDSVPTLKKHAMQLYSTMKQDNKLGWQNSYKKTQSRQIVSKELKDWHHKFKSKDWKNKANITLNQWKMYGLAVILYTLAKADVKALKKD